jgi:hypothetical protein
MSNEPTPKTDDFLSCNTSYMEKRAYMMQLERELAEVTKQRDVALSDLEFRRDLYALQTKQLIDMTVQRDRLAEALRMITTFDYSDLQCDNGHGARFVAAEALQSLTNQNEI